MSDPAFDRYRSPAVTAYHRTLAHLLERREPDHWRWFDHHAQSEDAGKALRLELLKRTYRLDRDTHGALYAQADRIAEAMALDAPVTLYQADSDMAAAVGAARRGDGLGARVMGAGALERNAALFFEPDRAHIVFSGDMVEALDAAEMAFVLGHELAHHKLWRIDEHRHRVAERLLAWSCAQPAAAPAYLESERLERLYTEVYADRYGLWAVGDVEAALRALLKAGFGLADVSGAAYLAQAEEALAAAGQTEAAQGAAEEAAGSAAATHPESHLRAALLAAWAHDPAAADARARALLEGAVTIERLDLLGQERVADLTHWMLYEFLADPWRGRDLIRAHARALSPELADALDAPRAEREDIDRLRGAIQSSHPSVKNYLAYMLLDFVTVDPEIDDVMLAAALVFVSDFGLTADFKAVATRELKTTKTKLADIEKNAVTILTKAEIAHGGPRFEDVDGAALAAVGEA
ncbi:MAG: M48 family metalloprotease, partial [Pseudomonadota bacterium]